MDTRRGTSVSGEHNGIEAEEAQVCPIALTTAAVGRTLGYGLENYLWNL